MPTKLISALLFLFALNALAVTRYVDLNSPSPTPPYLDWPTAATNIQDAIDAAVDGDLVLVTNGVYAAGGKTVYGLMTNRVAVDKPLILHSLNGPEFTIIEGHQVPGTTNGDGAIRCAYLTNGAVLNGFTLINGATREVGDANRERCGGGVWCESEDARVSNCWIEFNSATSRGGGAYQGTLDNCLVLSNWVTGAGGGVCSVKVINSTISGNLSLTSGWGGGCYSSTASNCAIAFNSAFSGGGADTGYLTDCLIASNSATFGGGAGSYRSEIYLNKCRVEGNSASNDGGGLRFAWITNSLVVGNVAGDAGGGGASIRARNCTIVSNTATLGGGCANVSDMYNCILFFNGALTAGDNFEGVSLTFNRSCSFPLPPGKDNITNAPLFVHMAGGDFRLQSNSPCINAGNNAHLTGDFDLDGNPRIAGGTVDMGAYEFQSPASIISYAWLQHYGLPADGSADFLDLDGEGMNNYGEWRSDTVPTNALSVLKIISATNSPTGMKVTWESVATRSYRLERGTDLGIPAPFQTVTMNILGVAGTKTYTDSTATNGGPYFYRVGVQ